MAKNTITNYVWIALSAAILYLVFSWTRTIGNPTSTHWVSRDWEFLPRGFWAGRPIAPHAGYPGSTQAPPPGPHNPPQGPPHGPPTPGPVDHRILG
jgi:hypothetical protein